LIQILQLFLPVLGHKVRRGQFKRLGQRPKLKRTPASKNPRYNPEKHDTDLTLSPYAGRSFRVKKAKSYARFAQNDQISSPVKK
jgi:hypothetical protein